jgi:DNA mismatch repair protein MutS2
MDTGKLELDKILERIAQYAVSDACRDKIRDIHPLATAFDIREELAKTDDAFTLAARFGTPRFDKVKDIRGSFRRAQSGSSLSLRELLDTAVILRAASILKEWQSQCANIEHKLTDYFAAVTPIKPLERAISDAVLSEEELSDNASPELFRLRRAILRQGDIIRDTLGKLVKSRGKFLQDSIVTQRDGRYVIPVKTEYRGEVSGLLHDTSSSGQTLFIEPMGVVEANNEIRILRGKEKEEIERIILRLSADVGNACDSLLLTYENIIELEYRFVKAQYASKERCVTPEISDQAVLSLRQARHPLINRDTVVPVSMEIGKDYGCLIITGPNTGGKTVALKTAGLLAVMAQCGLMIPAGSGSVVGAFSKILADIGDEQSIEQSLSTFSGHMTNIVDILREADEHSLVLLDELGSGTDPIEGSSLAVAILERLKSTRCLIMATTHYQEVKLYAIDTEGVENAGCEFDINTLRPTYRLIIGVPGKSNAFAIARRLGLNEDVIQSAERMVTGENRRFERIVESLDKTRQELESMRGNAEMAERKSEEMRQALERRTRQLDQTIEREAANARAKANSIINEVRFTADKLLDELDELRHERDKADFSERVKGARSKVNRALDRMFDEANPVTTPLIRQSESDKAPTRPLKKYDTVLLLDIGKKGTLLTDPDKSGNCMAQVGVLKTRTNVSNLRLAEDKPEERVKIVQKEKRDLQSAMTKHTSLELDIRGMDATQGVEQTERFIDDSIMSGLHSVTIIHGKGTGILRSAIHQYLKSNDRVEHFRLGVYGEGENGVTIVNLK